MKLKNLLNKKPSEVIEGENIKKFYERIEEKYREALKSGDKKEIERAKFAKKYKDMFPEKGFLRSLIEAEEKLDERYSYC